MKRKLFLLGLVLVIAVLLSGCFGDQIDLDASVRVSETQFKIKNNDNFDWLNVKMEVNKSKFYFKKDKIKAGETIIVDAIEFAKKDGTRFNPIIYKLQKFTISCDTPTKGEYGYYGGIWK
jgi:hypothetical protein